MRKIGVDLVVDYNDEGLIHSNESTQAVFFKLNALKVVDMLYRYNEENSSSIEELQYNNFYNGTADISKITPLNIINLIGHMDLDETHSYDDKKELLEKIKNSNNALVNNYIGDQISKKIHLSPTKLSLYNVFPLNYSVIRLSPSWLDEDDILGTLVRTMGRNPTKKEWMYFLKNWTGHHFSKLLTGLDPSTDKEFVTPWLIAAWAMIGATININNTHLFRDYYTIAVDTVEKFDIPMTADIKRGLFRLNPSGAMDNLGFTPSLRDWITLLKIGQYDYAYKITDDMWPSIISHVASDDIHLFPNINMLLEHLCDMKKSKFVTLFFRKLKTSGKQNLVNYMRSPFYEGGYSKLAEYMIKNSDMLIDLIPYLAFIILKLQHPKELPVSSKLVKMFIAEYDNMFKYKDLASLLINGNVTKDELQLLISKRTIAVDLITVITYHISTEFLEKAIFKLMSPIEIVKNIRRMNIDLEKFISLYFTTTESLIELFKSGYILYVTFIEIVGIISYNENKGYGWTASILAACMDTIADNRDKRETFAFEIGREANAEVIKELYKKGYIKLYQITGRGPLHYTLLAQALVDDPSYIKELYTSEHYRPLTYGTMLELNDRGIGIEYYKLLAPYPVSAEFIFSLIEVFGDQYLYDTFTVKQDEIQELVTKLTAYNMEETLVYKKVVKNTLPEKIRTNLQIKIADKILAMKYPIKFIDKVIDPTPYFLAFMHKKIATMKY